SGAEALMYMKSSDGDANKVLIAYSLIYMLPLSAKIPFNWRELTPVSVIALDQFVLWDNASGPKSVKDFITAAKAASSPFKMGGTGSKRETTRWPWSWGTKPAQSSPICPTSPAARRRRNWSAATLSPTSTTPPKTSKSGAP